MNESILMTIKKLLGPDSAYEVFDSDILLFINSAISTLTQIGVGPSEGFSISGDTETWGDFLGTDKDLESVKSYIYLKVRMLFDPPANATVMNAYEEMCKEYEWRLNVVVDPSRTRM